MSDREKKLLTLFLIAGFLIVNFFLYTLYVEKKNLFASELNTAQSQLQQAIAFRESSQQYATEMEWLAQHEPPAAAYQVVQNKLQEFAEKEAIRLGLQIRSEPLPTNEEGTHYHRAQVKFQLSGQEKALYQWFDAVNNPNAFRAAHHIRLSPNKDDTLIDCTATLSQWFPPIPPAS